MEECKKLLEEGYTCALQRGERILVSRERGVAPLLGFLDTGEDLTGCIAADKVVGKATAFLYLLLGASSLYAGVISRPALHLLRKNRVTVTYARCVPHIINRRGDGICPFEEAVLRLRAPKRALAAILEKRTQLFSQKSN